MKKLSLKTYKDKYTNLKDIYKPIRNELKHKNKRITYSTYFKIITKYFEYFIEHIAEKKEKAEMPYKLGKVYVKKELHKRPFHVRIDINESEKQGKIIKYKVPILNDYYNKLVWERLTKYKKYKILPLRKFKRLIDKVKEY